MKRQRFPPAVLLLSALALVTVGSRQERQTIAPHEQNSAVAPPPIRWPTPPLPGRTIELESAEQRKLRLVVMTRRLEQPWSMAFLPDGALLVTERPGASGYLLTAENDGALLRLEPQGK